MIDNFTPAGYPLWAWDWNGKHSTVIGWTLREGTLLPVVVVENAPGAPRVLDKPASYARPVA